MWLNACSFNSSYPCRAWPRRDISAEYDNEGISLQSMATTRYPCRVWPRRDIPAKYDHDEISLQSMTTKGYPCKVWPPRDNTKVLTLKSIDDFVCVSLFIKRLVKNDWVFVTNSTFLISISLLPNLVDLLYFKLWILIDPII